MPDKGFFGGVDVGCVPLSPTATAGLVGMQLLRDGCNTTVVTSGDRMTIAELAHAGGHLLLEKAVGHFLDEREWERAAAAAAAGRPRMPTFR